MGECVRMYIIIYVCACMHACSVHVHCMCASGMMCMYIICVNMILLQPRVLNWPQVFAIYTTLLMILFGFAPSSSAFCTSGTDPLCTALV